MYQIQNSFFIHWYNTNRGLYIEYNRLFTMADVKILLVEDENIEAMDIKLTLESFGYEVPYVASSGEEIVEKVLEIMPDLILMDIVLNKENISIDTVVDIKKLNIPLVYLTDNLDEVNLKKNFFTKQVNYLIKPYDPLELRLLSIRQFLKIC